MATRLNRYGWETQGNSFGQSDSSSNEGDDQASDHEESGMTKHKKQTTGNKAIHNPRRSGMKKIPGAKTSRNNAIQITTTDINQLWASVGTKVESSDQDKPKYVAKGTLDEPISPINSDKQGHGTQSEVTQNEIVGSHQNLQVEHLDSIEEPPQSGSKQRKSTNIPNFGIVNPSQTMEVDQKLIFQSRSSLDFSNEHELIHQMGGESYKDHPPQKQKKTQNIDILPEFQATYEDVKRPTSPIQHDRLTPPSSHKASILSKLSQEKSNLRAPRKSLIDVVVEATAREASNTPGFRRPSALLTPTANNNSLHSADSSDLSHNTDARSAKKSNESEIRPSLPKKTKEGVFVLQQSKKFTIDAQNHPSNLIIPHFSDTEITEAFKTLDLNKKNYITAQDLSFFLNVLEADATEAEIEEMIRMLDYEGTGRVYYQEFHKLATGKSLNPIGQAYPPTAELLVKKKAMDAQKKEEQAVAKEEITQGAPTGKNEFLVPEEKDQIKKQKVSSTANLNPTNTRSMRIECYQSFIRAYKIGPLEFKQLHGQVKTRLNTKQPICKYPEFLEFLGLPRSGDDYSWNLFNQLTGTKEAQASCVDIREILIGISACISLSLSQKLEYAFELFDLEGSGSIFLVSILKIFQSLLFGEDMTKIERKIRVIIKKKGIGLEDIISKDDYFWLAQQYPNLFIIN